MTVYVDAAIHPFHGMLMCHMWSESLDELYAMVDAVGVERKWVQRPPYASWVHFDISKGKRALAVKLGAVETDRYEPLAHVARLDIASGDPERAAAGERMLARVGRIRAKHRQEDAAARVQGDLFA